MVGVWEKGLIAIVGWHAANKAAAKRVESALPKTFLVREEAGSFGFDTPSPCDIVLQAQGRGIGNQVGLDYSILFRCSTHFAVRWLWVALAVWWL